MRLINRFIIWIKEYVDIVPYRYHLLISISIRLLLILYGEVQDSISEVPYTDVDYKVIGDAAAHVINGSSPFKRHTYRYTPFLAYMVIPNLLLHKCFGKILFSIFDVIVAIFIKKIIVNDYYSTFEATKLMVSRQVGGHLPETISFPKKYMKIGEQCSLIWLYNPMTMVIATRGNGDSISSFLVLLTIYFLLHPSKSMKSTFLAGLTHGLSIHFRLYPLIFSLPYYIVLSPANSLIRSIILPNRHQLMLVLGTFTTLLLTTSIFHNMYGFKFLYESYIYHLIRKDTRHNFSLYFYSQYLNGERIVTIIEKLATVLPQLIILFVLSLKFGRHRRSLPFCIFAQTFIMVSYNSVITSQYFVWFLSLFPLCAKNLKKIGLKSGIIYAVIWFLSQCGWLLPAYFLEFKGWNTFDFIWLQGILFFSTNIYILQRLIVNFDVALYPIK